MTRSDSIGESEKKQLYGLEVFRLCFYTINIFLECIPGTVSPTSACFRELETHPVSDKAVMITLKESMTGFKQKLKGALLDHHEYEYFKDGDEFKIPIEIKYGSRLYNIIQKEYPETLAPGIYYAYMVGDGTNKDFNKLCHAAFEHRLAQNDESKSYLA